MNTGLQRSVLGKNRWNPDEYRRFQKSVLGNALGEIAGTPMNTTGVLGVLGNSPIVCVKK